MSVQMLIALTEGHMVEQCTHKHILCKGMAKKTWLKFSKCQIQNFRHQATCPVFSHTLHRGGGGGGGEVGHYTVVARTRQWLQGRRNSLNRSPQPAVVSTYPHIPKSEPNLIMLVSYMYLFHRSFLYILSRQPIVLLANGGRRGGT